MDKAYEELHDQKRKVILSHYPLLCYNGQYRFDKAEKPCTYMLYGHVHDTFDQRLIEQIPGFHPQCNTDRAGEGKK